MYDKHSTPANKNRVWYISTAFIAFLLILALQMQAQTKTDSVDKQAVIATPKTDNPEQALLFDSEEVLHLKLVVNYKDLLKDRGEDPSYHKAVLSYAADNGTPVSIDLKVKARGNFRRNPEVCRMPPILLNFSHSKNTLFAGQNKLKLVTHCQDDEYVIKEYLVYKLYHQLSEKSFRVRLCKVDYEDTQGKMIAPGKYAFLIEEEDDMAKRNGAVPSEEKMIVRMDKTDQEVMAMVSLFEYMIGNCDWSVPYRHNIKLLSLTPQAAPIPVPYDFDHSGIVSAPYAKPPVELGITSVRSRLFRGYCHSDDIFQQAINKFNTVKKEMYQVYTNCSLLDQQYVKQTTKYLDAFYKTINTPKDFNTLIMRTCKSNERNSIVIKGLNK
jgi:hypothetical protein